MLPTPAVEFSEAQSQWKNPTDTEVKVDLFVGVGDVPPPTKPYARGEAHKAHLRVSWKPGETKTLPKKFDHALKDPERDGVGLAPMLVKVTDRLIADEPKADPSDDVATALENLDAGETNDEPDTGVQSPKAKRAKSSS